MPSLTVHSLVWNTPMDTPEKRLLSAVVDSVVRRRESFVAPIKMRCERCSGFGWEYEPGSHIESLECDRCGGMGWPLPLPPVELMNNE